MPRIFQEALDNYRKLGFHPPVSQSRENLCSHCFQVIPKGRYVCRHCGSEFWTPKDLAIRSLIFPSWGDLCMKHYHFATVEMIGYATSWFVAIQQLTGPNPEEGLLFAGMIFVLAHPVDAILTYLVAKKGLNPRRGPDDARAQAEQAADGEDEVVEVAELLEPDGA